MFQNSNKSRKVKLKNKFWIESIGKYETNWSIRMARIKYFTVFISAVDQLLKTLTESSSIDLLFNLEIYSF